MKNRKQVDASDEMLPPNAFCARGHVADQTRKSQIGIQARHKGILTEEDLRVTLASEGRFRHQHARLGISGERTVAPRINDRQPDSARVPIRFYGYYGIFLVQFLP